MTALHELPWNPLSPNEVVQLFTRWDRFWCIAGGWALDLFAGELSRPHDDIDVLILRRDISAIHTQLPGGNSTPPILPARSGVGRPASRFPIMSTTSGADQRVQTTGGFSSW